MTDRVQEVFEYVCDLPLKEREAYLDSEVGENPAVRREVESLLAAHDGAGRFLGAPTSEFVDPHAAPLAVEIGDVIGRYKLLERIGEGGFGVVYMAQQLAPIKRKVALKIIKLGMDTRQVVARFEAERQALGLMEHPNIANVFDGGATKTGRPYFVMELVRGDPITEFCDNRKLSTNDRLNLFLQVCDAVQHAHHKGIIHRDIKPNNVLVTVANDKPVAKVIDFGIAKATNSELTEKTLFTEFRQLIGTPEYMSPEQAERSGVDVDTRTDIYSLGVLLYEILTGTTPFDARRLRSAAWGTLQDIIRDEDPPVPSTRVSTLKDALSTTESNRAVSAGKLSNELRGELDWIVMMAMAKDRTQRYSTTAALGEDVQRYLEDQPVVAGPVSATYRLKKTYKRHKGAIFAAGTAIAALLIGLIAAVWMMFWALEERDHAREAEMHARAAERKARRASQLAETMADIAGNFAAGDTPNANEWRSQIEEFKRTMPPDNVERIQQECNYASWLCTHGLFNNIESCWDEAETILEELYPRAEKHLKPADPHYFSVTNAWLLLKVVHHKVDPKEVVGAYGKLIDSTLLIHGDTSEQFHELTLEYATLLLRANMMEDAVKQMETYLAYEGKPNYTMSHKYRLQMIKAAIDSMDSHSESPDVFKQVIAVHDEHADENTVPGFWGDDDDKEEESGKS